MRARARVYVCVCICGGGVCEWNRNRKLLAEVRHEMSTYWLLFYASCLFVNSWCYWNYRVSVSRGVSNLYDHIRNTEPAHLQADVIRQKYLHIFVLNSQPKLVWGGETERPEDVFFPKNIVKLHSAFLCSLRGLLEDLATDGDRLVGGFGHFIRRFSGESWNGCHACCVVLSCYTLR